jgi:branched-subunit amino acid transport protein AzlD
MKLSLASALSQTLAMGAVILFCRAFPFIFFRREEGRGDGPGNRREAFLVFVEKIVPPTAMTVLAVNAVAGSFLSPESLASWERLAGDLRRGLPSLLASAFTALVHLGKRNALLSILGGTAFYMVLRRVM